MKKFFLSMMTFCLFAGTAIFAADGTWNNAAGGAWETAGNWVGNTIADGAGNTATFNADTAAVVADANRTIGVVSKNSANDIWINGGPLILSGGTPAVDVPGGNLYMNCALAGSSGFDKTGAGWLGLYNTTISGDINVNAGWLWLFWADAIKNADVKVNSGTALVLWDGVVANGKSITVNNGGFIRPWDGTVGINAPLTCNYPDTGGNTFAVEAVGADDIINLNSNITLTANTVMATTENGGTINFNAPISGAANLRLLGRSAITSIGVFNFNAPCTYTGNTVLSTWGAKPRFEMSVNNALPCGSGADEVKLFVSWGNGAPANVTLDLNDKTQQINKLFVAINADSVGQKAIITGSDAGVLEITNVFTTWEGTAGASTLELTGGKIICNGPGCSLGLKMVITNATFINNGSWWGAALGEFELQSGAKIGGTGILGWTGVAASNLVITSGATITPGNSIGTVGCWNLEMQDGSEYDWEVGVSADMVDVRGDLDISAGGITVNVIDAGSPNGTYTLFAVTGSINGNPATDITMNYAPTLSGTAAYLSGNNIVADVVPEPATLGLLSLLALAFLRRK